MLKTNQSKDYFSSNIDFRLAEVGTCFVVLDTVNLSMPAFTNSFITSPFSRKHTCNGIIIKFIQGPTTVYTCLNMMLNIYMYIQDILFTELPVTSFKMFFNPPQRRYTHHAQKERKQLDNRFFFAGGTHLRTSPTRPEQVWDSWPKNNPEYPLKRRVPSSSWRDVTGSLSHQNKPATMSEFVLFVACPTDFHLVTIIAGIPYFDIFNSILYYA